MCNKTKYILLILLCLQLKIIAQSKILSGTVKIAGQPAKGVKVFTSFSENTTDALGRYTLSLAGCISCVPGNKVTVNTYKEGWGMSEQICTIGNDYRFDFSIKRNPEKFFIVGMVVNSYDAAPLPNISVKIIAMDAPIDVDAVKTNEFGEFKIPVDKELLENKNALRIQVRDPIGKYKPILSTPELLDISSFNTIKMEGKSKITLKVTGFTRTRICIKKGDVVHIEATGNMRIGYCVGYSDPDGRQSGLFGLSLEQYCLVKGINSSALIYRVGPTDDWKLAGKKKVFVADRPGCIEFEVNEIDKSDNAGFYEVEVMIE